MQYNYSLPSVLDLNIFKSFLKLTLCLIYSSALFALPDVKQVINGQVSIAQAGEQVLQINQNTDKAIINWNSFNVSANEKVHFQQPVNGVCLNRIDASNGMSQINGSLSSTAKIFLVNQAGILFGENARVNVGGIIASAIDIADDNFMNNKFIFDQTAAQPGAIINRGVIKTADGDIVALLGASVANEGIIQAKISNVALASGDKITIDLYGNDVLIFGIDAPTTVAGIDENGNLLPYGVNVSGQIINDGGHVFITAKAAQGFFDNLINMSGVVRARTVVQKSGGIILLGYEGVVAVTGELDVSGSGEFDQAGNVYIFGEHIIVDDYAKFNASAGLGQGTILIGNTLIGFNTTRTDWIGIPCIDTNTAYVGSNVKLNANTTNVGNGGHVLVMSSFDLTFLGTATAASDGLYGNGGSVMLWSRNDFVRPYLTGAGHVDVGAFGGEKGIVLVTSPFDKYAHKFVEPFYNFYQWIAS